jgi:two-component system cell cycle sensor histidine kinase/response regulator CckA
MAEQTPERPTILVIDDESAIQNFACRILTHHGYTVLEPRHAVHALQLCKQHQEPIHLLLTDVLMPYMHGYDLATKARALHPEMRVLYMTGYEETHLIERVPADEDIVVLRKPFSPDELIQKVRLVLEATRWPESRSVEVNTASLPGEL